MWPLLKRCKRSIAWPDFAVEILRLGGHDEFRCRAVPNDGALFLMRPSARQARTSGEVACSLTNDIRATRILLATRVLGLLCDRGRGVPETDEAELRKLAIDESERTLSLRLLAVLVLDREREAIECFPGIDIVKT
jgi:hypothetical protein